MRTMLRRLGIGSAARALGRQSLVIAAAILIPAASAHAGGAVDEVQAAQGPPFNLAVFVNSRADACYDPGDVAAIKRLTTIEKDRINLRGGVSGRPIQLKFMDSARDQQKTIDNVRSALADPDTLAMIGLSNATRGKAVFDALGGDILKSGIPFISDFAVNSIFQAFPNVYTTRASQDTDSVPVIARFTRQLNFQHPAFIGLRDSIASSELGDGLKVALGDLALVADVRLGVQDDKPLVADIDNAVAQIKEKRPDLVYLNVFGPAVLDVMQKFVALGVTPALFIGGRIDAIPADIANAYPNAIYSLTWDQPPEVFNDRLRTLITTSVGETWVFEGKKNPAAPGWSNGDCKPRNNFDEDDAFTPANMRAIGIGTQFSDMVALIATSARTEGRSTDVVKLRAQVLKQLQTNFISGRGAFKGTFDSWSFVPGSRAAARDPFVIILPQALGRTQLAPTQFVRSRDGSLRMMETLYADIDLIKAHRVDENDKSFAAEFYLALRDNAGVSIDNIEFANAYLDSQSPNGRQVSIEVIHAGGRSAAYPESMKIFKVSGKFLFDPQLANYPFDSQRFAIDIQPKNGDTPFIVQPPPLELRDHQVTTDGWDAKSQYVGYNEDFVPVVDAYTHAPSVVPFYRTSYVWQMQRQTTDYLLRVAVPLGFILFVAYLSIFIPRSHFEAIVTIQVTALLSAVALYLSLAKIDSDTATLSDRAFVFAYMVLSLMIGISILRINPYVGKRRWTELALGSTHIAIIPLLVAAAAFYAYKLSNI